MRSHPLSVLVWLTRSASPRGASQVGGGGRFHGLWPPASLRATTGSQTVPVHSHRRVIVPDGPATASRLTKLSALSRVFAVLSSTILISVVGTPIVWTTMMILLGLIYKHPALALIHPYELHGFPLSTDITGRASPTYRDDVSTSRARARVHHRPRARLPFRSPQSFRPAQSGLLCTWSSGPRPGVAWWKDADGIENLGFAPLRHVDDGLLLRCPAGEGGLAVEIVDIFGDRGRLGDEGAVVEDRAGADLTISP